MTSRIIRQAGKLGTDAGIAAASWVFDGNTSEDTYRRILQGIDAGDPEVYDTYREPSLSGEYADDYRSSDLAFDLGIEDRETGFIDECADAWAESASAAFWGEIERVCRVHVPPDIFTRRRDAIAYLMADGNLRVPCSRYGRDTAECAPIAWQVARITARESGNPVYRELLDFTMGLVVNDHPDIAYMVNAYGHGHYER
jgi:hypothetical protein